jgi:hypothetical protein
VYKLPELGLSSIPPTAGDPHLVDHFVLWPSLLYPAVEDALAESHALLT